MGLKIWHSFSCLSLRIQQFRGMIDFQFLCIQIKQIYDGISLPLFQNLKGEHFLDNRWNKYFIYKMQTSNSVCLNEYDKFAKSKTKQTKSPQHALVLHTWFRVYLMFVWSIDNIFQLPYLCFSMQKEVRLCIWRRFYQKEVAFFIKSKMHAPFCQRGIYWFTLMFGKTLKGALSDLFISYLSAIYWIF